MLDITHPDGSTESFSYTRADGTPILGMTQHTDREGGVSTFTYNGNLQISATRDPLQRLTRYVWCSCGHLEALIDSLGRRTDWKYDLLGRLTDKVLPDGATTSYHYLPRSGFRDQVTYPNQQNGSTASVSYEHDVVGRVLEQRFPGYGVGANAGLLSSFTYSDLFGGLLTAASYDPINGSQLESRNYSYYPFRRALGAEAGDPTPGAGRLSHWNLPTTGHRVSFTYDAAGITRSTALATTSSLSNPLWQSEVTQIDALGRVTHASNSLGSSTLGYTGFDPRLSNVTHSSGLTHSYSYLPHAQGGYLDSISQAFSGSPLTSFSYTYRKNGQIATWSKKHGSVLDVTEHFTYDAADQLLRAVTRSNTPITPITKVHDYTYDAAGNRTAHVVDGEARTARFNTRNQLTTGRYDGAVPVRGELSEWATLQATDGLSTWPVPLSGEPENPTFQTEVELTEGATTDLTLTATDPSGNASTQTIRLAAESGQWVTLSHNLNGNVTRRIDYDAGGNPTQTLYSYDRLNRLTRVSRGDDTYHYAYNAFDERISIRKQGGETRRFIWTGGNHPSLELTASAQPVAAFFTDGERRFASNGTPADYLYTKDHLGSVRDVVRSSDGQVMARYDYSPFGQRTKLTTVNLDTEWGFTGHFHHTGSDLVLTKYRAYTPDLGRWLSPDPLGEDVNAMGNLYNYVGNSPVNYWDPFGLQANGGNWHDLGGGWKCRVDTFNNGGKAGFETHLYKDGKEIGVANDRGWIAKHGRPGARPPGIPENIINKLNGINVDMARKIGDLPPKGKGNIKKCARALGKFAKPLAIAAVVHTAATQGPGEALRQGFNDVTWPVSMLWD